MPPQQVVVIENVALVTPGPGVYSIVCSTETVEANPGSLLLHVLPIQYDKLQLDAPSGGLVLLE
jgi:hypothetical protein